MGGIVESEKECWCMTAADLGMGYGEGINPEMIAHYHPDCPTHHGGDCQTRIRSTPPWCEHDQAWEVEVYSPGRGEWQTLRVCDPCMDALRTRHFEVRRATQLGRGQ